MNKLLLVMGILMAALSGALASNPRPAPIPGVGERLIIQLDPHADAVENNSTTAQPRVMPTPQAPPQMDPGLEAEEAPANNAVTAAPVDIPAELRNWLIAEGFNPDDVNDRNNHENYPLHTAVLRGNLDIVRMLLGAGARVNVREEIEESTPLHIAVKRARAANQQQLPPYLEIVDLLMPGAVVNAQDVEGWSPLHYAVNGEANEEPGGESRIAVVRRLLASPNINVNLPTEDGTTPLHLAVSGDDIGVLTVLLDDKRVNINSQDRDSHTPLYRASCEARAGVVRLLLERGADPNVHNNVATPLHAAIPSPRVIEIFGGWSLAEYIAIAALLIQGGANINAQDNQGRTPLWYAVVQARNVGAVQLLIDRGANVNLADNAGQAPLHRVAAFRDWHVNPDQEQAHLEMVTQLIAAATQAPGGIDIRDHDGHTPLWLAIRENNSRIAWMLVQNGADLAAVIPDPNNRAIYIRGLRRELGLPDGDGL